MKRRVFLLILLNAILWPLVFFIVMAGRRGFLRHRNVGVFGVANKIFMHNLETEYGFYLEKTRRDGTWEVLWGENAWPANVFTVEHFCEKLDERFRERRLGNIPRCPCYEITATAKDLRRTIKLTAEEMNILLFGHGMDTSKVKVSDDMVLTAFLSVSIFPNVRHDCKVFKTKSADGDFTFLKRHRKWFLDDSTSNLEIKSEPIGKFFQEIFALEAGHVSKPFDGNGLPVLSITLYGGKASERVNFFSFDGGEYLAENTAVDLCFFIDGENFSKVAEAVKNLLRFHIFPAGRYDDVSITVPANGEHFDLHDLKNQDRWQFTYAKDGELKVQEVSKEFVDALLELLNKTESKGIAQELDGGHVVFTATINGRSDDPKDFIFYGDDGGRLFAGVEGQNVKFEIDSSFSPALFRALRFDAVASNEGATP